MGQNNGTPTITSTMLALWACLLPLLLLGGGARAASQTFQVSNDGVASGITFIGEWDNPLSLQGHPVDYVGGDGNQTNFTVVGTGCTLACFGNSAGNQFSYSVDGGTAQIATPGATFVNFPLFTGLSDGPHTVQINFLYNQPIWLDRTATIAVTGAAPALIYSPGYGPVYLAGGTATVEKIGSWASSTWNNTFGFPQWQGSAYDDALRIQVAGENVSAFVDMENGCSFNIQVDGKTTRYIRRPSGGSYAWVELVSGLSPAQVHTVSLRHDNDTASAVVAFTVGGGTASLPPVRDTYAVYGDSITVSLQVGNNGGGLPVIYSGWPHLFGDANNVNIVNRGVGGSTVQGAAPAGVARTADITSLTPKPKAIVVEYGTNDMGAGAFNAAPTAFSTAYTSMLNALAAGCPNAKILCLGILPRTGYDSGTIASYTAAIQACVTALNNPNVKFVDPYNWIIAGTDQQDGTHPNTAGAAKVAASILAALRSLFGLLPNLAHPQGSRPAPKGGH